jgi:ribosomal protein L7/L12
VDRAWVFARASAGKSSPARIAMIAMTTSNSINVKARRGTRFPAGKGFGVFASGMLRWTGISQSHYCLRERLSNGRWGEKLTTMALIKCPECAHDVSDQAASCPRCGFPIQPTNGTTPAPAGAPELDALVRRTLTEKGKIAAIKFYRDRKPGVGLAEAKNYVERLEAAMAPVPGARSKPAGCLGLLVAVIVGLGLFCVIWFLR